MRLFGRLTSAPMTPLEESGSAKISNWTFWNLMLDRTVENAIDLLWPAMRLLVKLMGNFEDAIAHRCLAESQLR